MFLLEGRPDGHTFESEVRIVVDYLKKRQYLFFMFIVI